MKNQKKQFWVILIIVFLGFFGLSMPYLLFPALFLNPSYSIIDPDSNYTLLLGITLAAYPLGQFFGSPILGSLSDDYGRKKIIINSLLISSLCNLITGLAIDQKQLLLVIISRFLGGLMEGNIAIARALAADITSIPKQESFGKINAVGSIAFLLGPLLGGLLTDSSLYNGFSASTPFYFICVLFFGIAALSRFLLENEVPKGVVKKRSLGERFNIVKRICFLFSNKQLKLLMITSTIFALAIDIFLEFGPVYLTVKWALGPAELIYYSSALWLALALGNGWLAAYISSRFSTSLSYACSAAAFSLFLLGIVLTDSPFMMVTLFALCGLVIGIAGTLITVQISNSSPETVQGEVMGVQWSLRVLGDGIICLAGGVFMLISAKLILIMAGGLILLALAYYTKTASNLLSTRTVIDKKVS